MGSAKLLLIVQAILFAQVSSRAINISTTWTLPQEAFPHFFRFIHEPVTWDAATSVCESYQAELLTVETTERRDAVRAYLRELDVLDRVWIGLQRPSTGSPFVWTGGGPSEQIQGDGFWQQPPTLEPATQCVAINPLYDFRWLPLSCTQPETNPFICQLPVPTWAQECLVSSLPSLTITFLLERQVIELLSDCGLSGTRRIACKGGEKQADLIKRLSCERDEEVRNSTTTWSSSSRGHSWGTSTPSDSITSQMTRSSGTRHKRESRGTSAATDSSLLSTSDSTWEEKNNTESVFKESASKISPEATTITAQETNEDQIEESRGESIDQLMNLQTSVIESEGHQSEIATETEPPTGTSDEPQLKAEVVSNEPKQSEPLIEQKGILKELIEREELDPNVIPVIALEPYDSTEGLTIEIIPKLPGPALERDASFKMAPEEAETSTQSHSLRTSMAGNIDQLLHTITMPKKVDDEQFKAATSVIVDVPHKIEEEHDLASETSVDDGIPANTEATVIEGIPSKESMIMMISNEFHVTATTRIPLKRITELPIVAATDVITETPVQKEKELVLETEHPTVNEYPIKTLMTPVDDGIPANTEATVIEGISSKESMELLLSNKFHVTDITRIPLKRQTELPLVTATDIITETPIQKDKELVLETKPPAVDGIPKKKLMALPLNIETPAITGIDIAISEGEIPTESHATPEDAGERIDDIQAIVILDADVPHIKSSFGSPPLTKLQNLQEERAIEVGPTSFLESQHTDLEHEHSTEKEESVKTYPGKDALPQKNQIGSSSKNILYDKLSRPKNYLNFKAWPANQLSQDESIKKASESIKQETRMPVADFTQVAELQTEISVIVIAGMEDIDGNEHEDVEQVQPFTFVEDEYIVTSSEPSALKDETYALVQRAEKLAAEIQASATPVNSENTKAVPATGRPLVDMLKNDSVERKNDSIMSPSEPPNELSRMAAANEPKDTVSDSTTRVQTLSTPIQADLLPGDENNDEMETHKRPNRGRLYTHSGTLSFYPYFLNRVLG